MVGNNNAFLGVAFVHNTGNNSRFIEYIGARKGYGRALLNRIVNNARKNNKKNVQLMAIPVLSEWYKGSNFKVSGRTQMGLTPMVPVLRKNTGLKRMRNN